jgi:hypothetical protein
MAKQTFTTGQVLTAAQMTSLQSNDYNQTVSAKTASYVLVAADAGTTITMNSASATTITVNTSLFTAGDTLRIQNLAGGGTCTVTAGTATVTTASSLVIPSWGGGTLYFTSASAAIWYPSATTSGLTLITPETSFSAVSAVNVDGVFTSTYTNYLMNVNVLASGADTFNIRFRVGGVSTTTNYGTQSFTADNTTLTGARTSAAAQSTIGALRTGQRTSIPLYIYAPQIAQWTNVVTSYVDNAGSTTFFRSDSHCAQASTTQFDGVSIFCSTATITGTYSIYGFNK